MVSILMTHFNNLYEEKTILLYVKLTDQLQIRIDLQKVAHKRQIANPRHQTSQGQLLSKPERPLQIILGRNVKLIQVRFVATSSSDHSRITLFSLEMNPAYSKSS